MDVALDLITEALVTIKALAVGETAGPDMANDALNRYREVLESLSIQNLAVYATTTTVVPVVTNQAAYLLGPGGTGQRPLSMNSIDSAFITYNSVDYPLEVITQAEYDAQPVKSLTGIPYQIAFDNGFPDARVTLWPGPYQNAALTISLKKTFSEPLTLQDTFSMPPGYRRMVRLMLAMALLPDYPGMTEGEQQRLERDTKKATAEVKRGNIEISVMRSDAAGMGFHGGGYRDWRLGE